MPNVTDSRVKSVLERYFITGDTDLTGEGLSSYKRIARQRFPDWYDKAQNTQLDLGDLEPTDIGSIISDSGVTVEELRRILTYARDKSPHKKQVFKDYFGNRIKIGVFSDPHIGHEMFDEGLFRHMADTFRKQKVERIYCTGDVLEGMSGRPGHIYELSEIGFKRQIERAVKVFKWLEAPVYAIDGNHDGWYYIKNNGGMVVGEELEERLPNYNFLGQNEAFVEIAPGKKMHLFHPNDGSAYALSYKIQKLVETYRSGDKPLIVLEGHYHKAMYLPIRNVHAVECGTLSAQSWFMRGKKADAVKGFWILDIEMGDAGIGRFGSEFFPGYK